LEHCQKIAVTLLPAIRQAQRIEIGQPGVVPEDLDVDGPGGQAGHRPSGPSDTRQKLHVQGALHLKYFSVASKYFCFHSALGYSRR
jgi:hypothetical protein